MEGEFNLIYLISKIDHDKTPSSIPYEMKFPFRLGQSSGGEGGGGGRQESNKAANKINLALLPHSIHSADMPLMTFLPGECSAERICI